MREEIIKMAREAGMVVVDDEFSLIPFLERFFHMVCALEREACWRTAENYDTGYEAAAAIKAREKA